MAFACWETGNSRRGQPVQPPTVISPGLSLMLIISRGNNISKAGFGNFFSGIVDLVDRDVICFFIDDDDDDNECFSLDSHLPLLRSRDGDVRFHDT